MIRHIEINDTFLKSKIKQKKISFGGNRLLKIYGTSHCSSGRRMKRENRAFFSTENEAQQNGYRPCGLCMKREYKKWKNGSV